MGCCDGTDVKGWTPEDLAAGCWACPHSRPKRGFCRLSGASMTEITLGGAACPAARLPLAQRPSFVWVGLEWRGVPKPVRWLLGELGASVIFTDCGCIDRLKRWSERVERWPLAFWACVGVGRRDRRSPSAGQPARA